MDYGFLARNNSGSVTISTASKALVFSERGNFSITSRYNNREGFGQVSFSKVITTQEPPQVFARCVTASHPTLSFYTRMLGGPGNWTGVAVTSPVMGGALQNFSVEYVACKFSDRKSSSNFGMEIYDEVGSVTYTSSDRVVKYSKFSKKWVYTPPQVAYGVVGIFSSDVKVDADDYISISSIDRGNSWFMGRVDYAGIRIRDASAPALKILINLNRTDISLHQGSSQSFFSIPVCKFPIDRYYNE